jgi:Rrf2 family iron-sulfur cluster assembly transcriptional regulator
MNLGKSARYALLAAVDMAASGEGPVTVSEAAARYSVPPNALAKVFQQLVRAGVAVGTRGVGGGYRLARAPAEVSVLEVVSVFEPPRPAAEALPGPAERTAGLRGLFAEVDEMVRCTYASVSLETLVRSRPGAAEAR